MYIFLFNFLGPMDQSFTYEVLGAQATVRLVVSFNVWLRVGCKLIVDCPTVMAGYNRGFYISILSRSRRIEPNHCKFGWNSAANGPVLYLRGAQATVRLVVSFNVWLRVGCKLIVDCPTVAYFLPQKPPPYVVEQGEECNASISPFYQGHGESNQITANLVGTQQPMDQSFTYEVLGAQATVRLVVSFNVWLRPMDQSFTYEVLGAQATVRLVVSFNVWLRVGCSNRGFYISILSRSRRIEPNHCKFGWNTAANGPVLYLRGAQATVRLVVSFNVWLRVGCKLIVDCPTVAYFLPQKPPPYVVEQGEECNVD
ncbi:hypothetical protein ACJIZ3_000101 [Penstemon smallii]|uniref:Uncharacterized protein n=1 Tax=Penstemon smallii TaxID=265156 RepID=A0ABD3RA15_9LAMI